MGCGFSPYILIHRLWWVDGLGFLTIYICISSLVSRCVGVSHHIYWYIVFSEPLGWGFSTYILIYRLHWAAGLGILSIYTYISSLVSRWVGVSHHIYLYIVFSEPLGWGFSPYILIYRLQWVAGLGFLSLYTYISSPVSSWVGVSHHIYLYIVFSEPLGWCFSPYILIYRL